MIRQKFLECVAKYTADVKKQQMLWREIETKYSGADRHYHNLTHLDAMLAQLEVQKEQFHHWDTILFAIVYHDLVYSCLKRTNEELSAKMAAKRLAEISFPEEEITFCRQLILATKKHEPGDEETNLFTDADLSILGADSRAYQAYSRQIRQEYAIYPDLVYNPGRRKVLLHFLEMESIYKTKAFSDQYELAAKNNLLAELASLE